MPTSTKKLVIDNWQRGIAESPYLGFAQMRNVDIFTQPGALKISRKLAPSGNSESIVDGIIIWQVQDPTSGYVYSVDTNGKLYQKDTSDVWTVITGHGIAGADGQGLAIWKNYLFYARELDLDVYGPLGGGATWTNGWQTYSQNVSFRPMLSSGQRFVLYLAHGNFIDSLEQVPGQTFDPSNPATYVYNQDDLELGSYFQILSLEEVGSNISIATRVGDNTRINIGNTFFWDGVSDFVTGGLTIYFADNGVWQQKNVNNALYSVAGTGNTRLFASNTAVAQEIKRFNNINITPSKQLKPHQGAIDLLDGELLIGVGRRNGTVGDNPLGVYSYRNGAYVLRNAISTGEVGMNGDVDIGSIFVYSPDSYLVSYYDALNAKYGVDYLTTTFYTGYQAQVESAVYSVATDDDPVTFEKAEIRLGRPMRITDKVKLSARYDLTSVYVPIAEFLGTDYANKTVIDKKVSNLGSFKNFQTKIELDMGALETSSPELMSVSFD